MKNVTFSTVVCIIKLLIYYVIYQGVFTILPMMAAVIYGISTGSLTLETFTSMDSDVMVALGDYGIWAMALGLFLSAVVMMWHISHFGYFNFGPKPLKQVKGSILLLSVVLIFATMVTFNIFAQWAGLPDMHANVMEGLSKNIVGVLAIAVAAPVLEEMLFRGAIQGMLMRRFSNPWVGIIIASLIFGAIHMNPIQVFYATMLGLVFGWIYYRTGSLVPVVIGHVLNNSMAAATMFFGLEEEEMAASFSAELVMAISAAVVAVVMAYFINKLQPSVPKPWHAAGEELQVEVEEPLPSANA
ncbi:MAG: CPBP family intramembrane metalloprotease [Bacteroidaceae bacterium]|nr:CPBP family intramembrane metalloprotease [Bacteroidaceae bacterium]